MHVGCFEGVLSSAQIILLITKNCGLDLLWAADTVKIAQSSSTRAIQTLILIM